MAQTENAIQNIILEELENFEGILMATTNLANNLDTAFERRFYSKYRSRNPQKVRAKIWKSKLPHLADEHCQILAEKFDFSGGQIDNIIRKSEIQEIVHGTMTNFEEIQSFCSEESIITKQLKLDLGMHTIKIKSQNILLLSDTHGKHRLIDIPKTFRL